MKKMHGSTKTKTADSRGQLPPVDVLPSNDDAEKAILGLTLLSEAIPSGAKRLATTDFYNHLYREIWGAFVELDEENRAIDAFAAHEIVKRNNPPLAAAVSVSFIAGTAVGLVKANENVYVQQIREAATRRHIIRKLRTGIDDVAAGEKGVIQNLRRMLADLELDEQPGGRFRPLSEIIEQDVKPALHDLSRGVTHRISTGFDAIDAAIGGGLSLSDILLVAGLPGGGKSAFVLQLAANIAKQNIPVAFLSGEMSDKENGLRLLSQMSGTHNLNSVTKIFEGELDFYVQWADAIARLPIYFDSRTYDMQTIAESLRSVVEQSKVKVLVIDYIQLLRLSKLGKQSRTERITEVSQEVKRIAMEYGVAVIEVAQFNREGAKSGKPTMHDLEGSSQLEKDTSLIFLIDREEPSDAFDGRGGDEITIRIDKGRNTGKSSIRGRFEGWKLKFEF